VWCFSEKDEAEHRSRELRFLRKELRFEESNTGFGFKGDGILLAFRVGL